MLRYLKNNAIAFGNACIEFLTPRQLESENIEGYLQEISYEIDKKGYYVIDNFYSSAQCAEVVNEIERMIVEHRDRVWVDDKKSDHRLHAADRRSDIINRFYTDRLIRSVSMDYMGSSLTGFTLAARLDKKEGNLGSGGGWHRDAIKKQIKSIIYLSDVETENGPFQYFEGSHKNTNKIENFLTDTFKHHTRYTSEEIASLAEDSAVTFTGKAGTLLLVDTSGIHRGKPIESGRRYALTNYFWRGEIPRHISDLFI